MKNPDEFPEITTDRLVLREITENDVEWYLRHFSLPEIADTTGFDGPVDLDAAREELDKHILRPFRESTGIRWGITLKGSDRLIGSCGYFKWEHDPHRRIEIGYDLDPAHWRKGIMKEALTAIIDYGFERMDLNRITLLAFSFNEPSVGLARNLGFVREGVLRENSFHRGRFWDDEYFALLRSDWVRTREPKGQNP
jgi:ribosomal-protein-alanine N-acetyltransferase